jgi:hypothetical protein
MSRLRLVFAALLAVSVLPVGTSRAAGPTWHHPFTAGPTWHRPFTEESHPDVFYNLYVPGNGGNPAAAYPAPLPTPPIAGHVYYTYQPLMPAEFLYHHHRSYHQYYDQGRGLNRTIVHWYSPPVRTGAQNLYRHFRLAR